MAPPPIPAKFVFSGERPWSREEVARAPPATPKSRPPPESCSDDTVSDGEYDAALSIGPGKRNFSMPCAENNAACAAYHVTTSMIQTN